MSDERVGKCVTCGINLMQHEVKPNVWFPARCIACKYGLPPRGNEAEDVELIEIRPWIESDDEAE